LEVPSENVRVICRAGGQSEPQGREEENPSLAISNSGDVWKFQMTFDCEVIVNKRNSERIDRSVD
jgi:hypothetical protein